MPRNKKDAVMLNIRLDRVIAETLADYCERTGQTKTMAVERMLQNELKKYYQQPEGKRVPR